MNILKKFHPILASGLLLLLPGCAQNTTTQTAAAPETTPVEKAEQGAKAAARFAVGQVVGTPAKIAMAAGTVAGTVEKKIGGSETQPSN